MIAAASCYSLACAFYGRAVERLVGTEAQESMQASQFLNYVGKGPGPDFIGVGPYTGMRFDITTPLQVESHLNRSYGRDLINITYDRSPHVFDSIFGPR